ncbi:hypothetical protein Pla52o_45730 [Novipirellula galeiformis]|uniref:Uncharacterized protein n=1 Tax=Novipirellula galeiformis TaxID=2528004 RepID=A0A5C6CBA6_9BACT|nr:hypothetical protein Pla52o_45730 [Novipirellula galeiformis]
MNRSILQKFVADPSHLHPPQTNASGQNPILTGSRSKHSMRFEISARVAHAIGNSSCFLNDFSLVLESLST